MWAMVGIFLEVGAAGPCFGSCWRRRGRRVSRGYQGLAGADFLLIPRLATVSLLLGYTLQLIECTLRKAHTGFRGGKWRKALGCMNMATHLPNERALVAAAQLGNHEAFAALVNQYQQNIFRLALRITGNHEDAEDALQEAFLKAYCNLKRFQGESLFYTWLVRITMNEALMKLRRSKRLGNRQLPIDEFLPLSNASTAFRGAEPADPERWYAQVELRETLSRALGGISGRLSDAFVLRNVADLSIKETAATLGLSVAGVKSRLLRARCRLRQRLRNSTRRLAVAGTSTGPNAIA
jgi:RNA polymerase sigma-70 factor (ECF subfamily)